MIIFLKHFVKQLIVNQQITQILISFSNAQHKKSAFFKALKIL